MKEFSVCLFLIVYSILRCERAVTCTLHLSVFNSSSFYYSIVQVFGSFFFLVRLFALHLNNSMSSFPIAEQEESLFLLDEQPPATLQKSESFDDDHKSNGLKSLQRILSASSSLTSTNQPYRSSSAHDLTNPIASNDFGLPPMPQSRRSNSVTRSSTNDIDAFVRQFETRLREHRLIWQKEYDSTVQRMNESKAHELETLKVRYESKLHAVEDGNKQLEMILEQLNDENKRVKFEFEHYKQQTKAEQVENSIESIDIVSYFRFQLTIQESIKELQTEMERKVHELKSFHENEKQEIRRQHSRMYQDLLDETNQVKHSYCRFFFHLKRLFQRLKKMELITNLNSRHTIRQSPKWKNEWSIFVRMSNVFNKPNKSSTTKKLH